MKNLETKTENATIINGVVLTEDGIVFLKSLQDQNNSYLKEAREQIMETISQLLNVSDCVTSERETEINELMKYLNTFHRNLKGLMKP